MDTALDDDDADDASEFDHTRSERRLVDAMRANSFPGLAGLGTEATPSPEGEPSGLEVARIGRYAILRELGRGGMGIVYLCHDEQLDRKVAVKLLGTRVQTEAARVRLEREAQALARLSHPNVVQIYERGDHFGSTFVAMEYVVGETLRTWLRDSASHDWRERATILRACGAGLAAAHAQGLVHRDFKPDNVLVGADGRARVLDFGIVRRVDDEHTSDSASDDASEPEDPLTRTGAVMGTPAYMSPEQFAAGPCDARSDQFSFCVVAFETLLGERPFVGTRVDALSLAVRSGAVRPIPNSSPVPKSLQAALLRGLASDPSARWVDMPALLVEFDRVLEARKPRRIAWALGGAAIVALALPFLRGDDPPAICEFDETALRGTWDSQDREALRGRLDAEVATRVDESLTSWTSRWLASQRRACEATHVQGSQSASLLDLRATCLEGQRREVEAIVELLRDPASPNDVRALELLGQLPDLAVCDDPRLAETSHPLPSNPVEREAIEAARGDIQRVRSLARFGRIHEADALVESLARRAPELGHVPLEIEVDALGAERLLWRGRVAEAVPILRAAIRAAEVARLDELVATLRTELATQTVGYWGRPEMQAMMLDEAEAAVVRIGRADDRRALELELARARWFDVVGDYAAARAGYESCLAAARERGDLVLTGRSLRELGHLLVRQGRFDQAETSYAEARASFEADQGPSAQLDAEFELLFATLALQRGDFDAAERRLAQTRSSLAELRVADTEATAMLELAAGKLAFMRGDLDAAAHAFARVTELDVDDLRVAEAWEASGVIRFYQGDFAGSITAYRRALALRLATQGPEHPEVGVLHSNLGESLAASGDHEGALAAYADALAILERALPEDHPDLALPYKGRAQSRLMLGQRDGAILDLERALQLHASNPGEPIELSDVEFTLARALHDAGEHERARALAERARARLLEFGHQESATTISNWIRDHE